MYVSVVNQCIKLALGGSLDAFAGALSGSEWDVCPICPDWHFKTTSFSDTCSQTYQGIIISRFEDTVCTTFDPLVR